MAARPSFLLAERAREEGCEGQAASFLLAEWRRGWSLMIFCARATRGLRRMERIAWPSSCSRNAHNQNVLVRRAQSRIDQATLESEMGKGEDARSGRPI